MKELEEYLIYRGFESKPGSWKKVKNLDNWIEVDFLIGTLILRWRIDGKTVVHSYSKSFWPDLPIVRLRDKIEELWGQIWLDEMRDEKLIEIGI